MMAGGAPMSTVAVENARQQWKEGHRRLESRAHDRKAYLRLNAQVESLLDELRRRIGQTYTLEQLAAVYAEAEPWSRDAAASGTPAGDAARPEDFATVEDAAFHLYARGALDYAP
jgi:hypothetical protein